MRLELCESGPLPGKYEPLNLLDYIRRLKTTRAARKVLPYRGGGPALQDLVAGHVDSYFGNPAEIVGQTGGRIRVLATSGATRLKSLPEVQTLSESYPGLSLVTWNGLVYLDGTPQEMIQKVSRAIQRGSQDAEYVKALTNIGVDVIGDTPEHFDASIRASLTLWKEAIDAAGIKPQ